jgi:hypothetical protein
MSGINTLTFTRTDAASFNGQGAAAASSLGALSNGATVSVKNAVGTSSGNAAVGGGDEAAAFLTTISASGDASINLTSLTDILGTSAVSLARVKDLSVNLLSEAQDATYGTNCTSITLGDSGTDDWVTQSHGGGLGATSTFDLPNGGNLAASFPTAAGNVVDGTHKYLYVVNNDASNAAKVLTVIAGGSS